jgi:hypothetical protein
MHKQQRPNTDYRGQARFVPYAETDCACLRLLTTKEENENRMCGNREKLDELTEQSALVRVIRVKQLEVKSSRCESQAIFPTFTPPKFTDAFATPTDDIGP